MSRIIKSTLAQNDGESQKVISLRKLSQVCEGSSQESILIGKASLRGDEIIEQATIEADRIIGAARENARQEEERMLHEKENWIIEREQLMQEAYNTGFVQGEEDGKRKGFEAYQSKLQEANTIADWNKEQFENHIQSAEQVILSLGIKCAEKILNRKLEEEPDLFLSIVERGLKEVRDLPHIQIHVHPSRHMLLSQNKAELEMVFPTNIQCFIYANDDLGPDESYIETNQGRVIISIDSQLNELKLKLHQLLEGDSG